MAASVGGLFYLIARARRPISRGGAHYNPALALINQVEDIGGGLQPLNALRERPILFCFRIRKRFQQSLNEGMQNGPTRTVKSPAFDNVRARNASAELSDINQGRRRLTCYIEGVSIEPGRSP